jgi:tetratricopeptide (TPR) repeat protein
VAERGIVTALQQLAEPDRSQALLLLSEALQEQSRWNDSLEYLDRIEPDSDQYSVHAFLLKSRARRRLGFLDMAEHSALLEQLLTVMRSEARPVNIIRAAVEGASVLETIRCNSLAPFMLQCLSSADTVQLGLDDAGRLLLAKSMLLYQAKELVCSLDCARKGVDLLEKNNHPSSLLAMLQNGIGAILSKQGMYEQSIPEYLRCYETATRIGNDLIYAQASANLSLSFMRIGDYDKAISWGEVSLRNSKVLVNFGFAFQGAQAALLAYAMTGRNRNRAEELILETRTELARRAPPGVSQAWALSTADAYSIMGAVSEAEEEAIRGLQLEALPLDFCAGPYARWLVKTSETVEARTAASERLTQLIEVLSTYDALDQAEILNAKCWLNNTEHRVVVKDLEAMLEHLNALPPAISQQLVRMGMLAFMDSRSAFSLRS